MRYRLKCAVLGASVGTLMLVAACSTITGNDFARVRGLIVPSPGFAARVITAPDTVSAGVRFTVSVTSFGSGTCTRADGATVSMAGVLVTISVWDREQIGGVCTDDLRPYPREVSLRINDAGRAMIRVQGRGYPRAANGQDSVVVVEKQIVVR